MQLKTPKFWTKKNLISYALLPTSFIYFVADFLIKFFTRSHKISKPVICIGNLISGGSGKTPTAIAVGKILRQIAPKDFEFAFLSRGYMGDGAKFVALQEGKHIAENVGDEPLLLTETAPTFVAKNRLFGALQIENINKIKAIILDDGMQNNALHKDLKIVVVDGKIGFGNEFLIPAGPMRETISSGLKKSDLVVLIGEAEENLEKKLSGKKIVRAKIVAKNSAEFSQQKLMAFCGLAYPQKFFTFLKKSGLEVVVEKSFPDHYFYQYSDLEELYESASKQSLKLVTTKKDWIKFSPDFQKKISYLDIELEFLNPELLIVELQKVIKL